MSEKCPDFDKCPTRELCRNLPELQLNLMIADNVLDAAVCLGITENGECGNVLSTRVVHFLSRLRNSEMHPLLPPQDVTDLQN
jgi:hypothetical protein